MKVPKYIIEAIEKNAIYAMRANENNKKIRDWLEKQNVTIDSENEIVIDMLIDCVELTNNHPRFIKFINEYEVKK